MCHEACTMVVLRLLTTSLTLKTSLRIVLLSRNASEAILIAVGSKCCRQLDWRVLLLLILRRFSATHPVMAGACTRKRPQSNQED